MLADNEYLMEIYFPYPGWPYHLSQNLYIERDCPKNQVHLCLVPHKAYLAWKLVLICAFPPIFFLPSFLSFFQSIWEYCLLQEDDDMLIQVKQQKVTEQTLLKKLTEYVERVDTDMVTSTPELYLCAVNITEVYKPSRRSKLSAELVKFQKLQQDGVTMRISAISRLYLFLNLHISNGGIMFACLLVDLLRTSSRCWLCGCPQKVFRVSICNFQEFSWSPWHKSHSSQRWKKALYKLGFKREG